MAGSRYLIDTTVFIDFSRGHPTVIKWMRSFEDEPERLATSCVVVNEFFCGIPTDRVKQWKRFFQPFEIMSDSFDTAIEAAEIYRTYRDRGLVLARSDITHGVIARQNGLAVATSNTRHFPFVDTFDPRGFTGTI
jgi:predicted nucleic acid-binding protein